MLGFRTIMQFLLVAMTLQIAACTEFFKPFNVSYDHRALIIDGKRRMLISSGVHYPRATPEMWPDLIAKSKEGGADLIQTYAFWNGHEPVRGQYNFEGRYDIVKFIKLAGSAGLYFHLRIGPYACAEWNFGGFPVWLRDIPGIEFRTDNAPFKDEMQRFVKKMVDLMRQEMLFSWQGGPIILLQIENEYGNIEGSYGQRGKDYVKWAADMAVGLGAGVPWVMCRQTDAPENIIDTCNGFYCDGFKPNSYRKPALWTEDWNGWYTSWGERVPHRPVEDNAFAVARFFQRGGSYQNYYMFFGGTNFGRTSGGPFYVTSYDYDAPIDEYGLLSQPKWGHLKDLHAAIKLCEQALVAVDDAPRYIRLGPKQEAHVYQHSSYVEDQSSSTLGNGTLCSAFLANIDEHNSANVKFLGQVYSLPPWSVSILPDCKNVAFNTAKVGSQISVKTIEFGSPFIENRTEPGYLLLHDGVHHILKNWMILKEPIGEWGGNNFTAEGILEHLNVTKDTSDYLWYIMRLHNSDEDISFWEASEVSPKLIIDSMRDVVRIFVNGQLAGSHVGRWVRVEQPVDLVQGYNELAILSETVGLQSPISNEGAATPNSCYKTASAGLSNILWCLVAQYVGQLDFPMIKCPSPTIRERSDIWLQLIVKTMPKTILICFSQNYGAFLEKDGAGFRGQIKLTGLKSGENDLTNSLWVYQVGLWGEFMKIFSLEEHESADWVDLPNDSIPSAFTWYKTFFDAPKGKDPVSLYLGSMGKGQAWVNGHSIGRYWSLVAPVDGCQSCDYRGAYHESKCTTNCGKPTQSWYHIPRSWLQPSNNLLVIFEETGGNPLEISVKLHSTSLICAKVSESHYPPLHLWSHQDIVNGKVSISNAVPEIHLQCDNGQRISSITFASFGTPQGSCQRFSQGDCHAPNSFSVVSEACQGRNNCSIGVSNKVFGGDPCHGVVKTLAVEAKCMSFSEIGAPWL